MGQLSYLCSCENVIQANLLESLLEDYGIQAKVHVPMNVEIGHPQVFVHSADREFAAGIASEFHRHVVVRQANEEGEIQEADAWWTCESCGASRITRCPDCAAEGSNFHVGYQLPTVDEAADEAASVSRTAVCLNCDALFMVSEFEPCLECTKTRSPQRETPEPPEPPEPIVTAFQVTILFWSGLIGVAALLWVWYHSE